MLTNIVKTTRWKSVIYLFLFFPASLLADALAPFSGASIVLNPNANNSISVPGGFSMKKPREETLEIYSGNGAAGDDLDDRHSKPGRPGFYPLNEHEMTFREKENWLQAILDNVSERIEERPPTRYEQENYLAWLADFEEAVNDLREQETLIQPISARDRDTELFRHRRPGFQSDELRDYISATPAISELPLALTSQTKTGINHQEEGNTSPSGATRSPRQRQKGFDDDGYANSGRRPPAENKKKLSKTGTLPGYIVTTKVNVDDDEYEVEAHLHGANERLFCIICQDLVEAEAASCASCEKSICRFHIGENTGLNERCPSCMVENPSWCNQEYERDLANLLWTCPGHQCSQLGTLENMPGHIKSCQAIQYICENREHGCHHSGSYDNVEEHEKQCSYRQIRCRYKNCDEKRKQGEIAEHESQCPHRSTPLGYVQLKQWEYELIKSKEGTLPGEFNIDQAGGADTATALSLLIDRVGKTPKSPTVICGLCNTNLPEEDLKKHQEVGCPYQIESCYFCGNQVLRKHCDNHMQKECEYNFVICKLCKTKHLAKDTDAHNSVCIGAQCSICSYKTAKELLPAHERLCQRVRVYADRLLLRDGLWACDQTASGYPVYQSQEGNSLFLFLPFEAFKHKIEEIFFHFDCYKIHMGGLNYPIKPFVCVKKSTHSSTLFKATICDPDGSIRMQCNNKKLTEVGFTQTLEYPLRVWLNVWSANPEYVVVCIYFYRR